MKPGDIFSAKDLIGAFNSLPDLEKWNFMMQLWEAIPPTATHLLAIFKKATDVHKQAFSSRILKEYLLPLIPEKHIHATMDRVIIPQIQALLLKQKKKRDRANDPETIRQNVEICDLRKEDKKKWSMGQLARKFGMARQSISKILKKEENWRQLLSNLPSK